MSVAAAGRVSLAARRDPALQNTTLSRFSLDVTLEGSLRSGDGGGDDGDGGGGGGGSVSSSSQPQLGEGDSSIDPPSPPSPPDNDPPAMKFTAAASFSYPCEETFSVRRCRLNTSAG